MDEQTRWGSVMSMFGQPPEITSALEEDVLPAELEARKRAISSNFLAAIPENPDSEDLSDDIASGLLARRLASG